MNTEETPLPQGIQHIALSFSGGGFRAAIFSLGCCSYLDSFPYDQGKMLDKVRYISSVSGGSITALALFAMQKQGKSFESIYNHILKQISGTDLLDQVFKVLEEDSYWTARPDKSRNLINAFAIVYDRDLFLGADYGTLFTKRNKEKHPYEDELCVNSTELNNGMNFRFGTKGRIGNQYLSLNRGNLINFDLIKQMKLGDLLACSSCFPGGFEPVIFPKDFTFNGGEDSLSWEDLGKVVKTKDYYSGNFSQLENAPEMFGLMDGGIDDNQGIYAFRMADERKSKGFDYDLYLTCDVSSNYLEKPFKFPKEPKSHWMTDSLPILLVKVERYLLKACIIIAAVLLVSALMLFLDIQFEFLWTVLLVLSIVSLTIGYFANRLLNKIKRLLKASGSPGDVQMERPGTWGTIFKKYYPELMKLSLSKIWLMILSRASSLHLLAESAFLKKIRRASYEQLYTDNNRPNKQIGVTAVYLLSTKNDRMLQQEIKTDMRGLDRTVSLKDHRKLIDVLQPGDLLRLHIDRATAMETTLWFDDYHLNDGASESLLIAGQATTCFNLLRMALRIDSLHPSWPTLIADLLVDWEKFKSRPEWLMVKYSQDTA